MPARFITHPMLEALGVDHGFGERGAPPPDACARVTQVHGRAVAGIDPNGVATKTEADALVTFDPRFAAAVVTADCVPILACTEDARGAVAIHAGWRGLAAGVVEAGIAALRAGAQAGAGVRAVIGPHIGACCYEVDAPVLDGLSAPYPAAVAAATTPTRPGHARIDLGAVVHAALTQLGVAPVAFAAPGACTACEPRFESYRRDGAQAGRMLHFIRPAHAATPSAARERG